MTTLVTGGHGALGREFARVLPDALAPRSTELDVRDGQAVDAYVHDNHVERVIHCAALTSVRYCEDHPVDTLAVNVEGTRNLCQALTRHASSPSVVFISTACVFAGDDPAAAYSENEAPRPKNFYAQSKLMAECIVRGWAAGSTDGTALVVRTNFAERGEWKYPVAFTDRFGTYLYPDLVADRVARLVQDGVTGVVHVCGDRRLSMYEFARLDDPRVGQTTLADYQGPPVTVNMSLRSVRIAPVPLLG